MKKEIDRPARLRLGVSPVIWTNDDLPSLGDHISLDRCLAEARAAGYAGIELGHKFPRDPEALRARLTAHDLALVSGWYGGRLLERGLEAELEAIKPQADLLLRLGCEVLVYAEVSGCAYDVPLEARRRLNEDDFKPFGHGLSAFAEALKAKGLALAYHHHMGTVIQTFDELELLIGSSGDDVGVTLDTGHAAFAGVSPSQVIDRLQHRIRHVHLKDVRTPVLEDVKRRTRTYLDAIVEGVFTVPGDGDLDFREVLSSLRDANYQGWLVVEADQDPSRAEPARFARLGAEHVRSEAALAQWHLAST